MIPLFFLVVCSEGVVAFLLVVKIGPFRDLIMKCLDQVKMRRATVLTIAGTIFAILLSNLFSILKIQNKGAKIGTMTPMDQVLWRTNLLEATLMGFTLFLGFLIDRIHHYMHKLIKLRSSNGVPKDVAERLEKEKLELKQKEEKAAAELKKLRNEVSGLTEILKKLKWESTGKDKRIESAESEIEALRKTKHDLFLEYDRLLEDNERMQKQFGGYPS